MLVENQLEWTDHPHLGQLLTYASGLDAVTLVWIAERFTDEHRAVLDWLNDVTDERIRCFGLEVEVWRIGDSAAAPKFNLVSKPNGWTKQVAGVRRTAERSVPSTTKLLYQEYWSELNEVLARSNFHLRRPKPQAKNWTRFSTGQPGTRIYAFASAREGYLGVELILNRPGCAQLFDVLQGQRPEIESEIGQPLEWTEHPGSYRIVLRQNGFDPTDRVEWGRQHTWFVDRLKQYDHVFLRRIAKQPETMGSD